MRGAKTFGTLAAIVAVGLLATVPVGQAGLASGPGAAETCTTKGTAPVTVARSPDEIDARLDDLYEVYAGLPGFVDVYFQPTEDPAFRPTFVREVPQAARDRPTPVPVGFDVLPAAPTPPGPESGPGPLPSPSDLLCTGIRPGASLSNSCTINFIFTDGSAIYAGTAGHCIGVGNRAAIPGVGQVGTVVFSRAGGVGQDFALIEIDPAFHDRVSAEMCDFGGPSDTFDGGFALGTPTLQTGHGGGGVGDLPPRPKTGSFLSWGARSFQYVGGSVPGDSGSPVRLAGGEALGTLTHINLLIPVQNFGTTWDGGLDMAAEEGFTGLELVTSQNLHPV